MEDFPMKRSMKFISLHTLLFVIFGTLLSVAGTQELRAAEESNTTVELSESETRIKIAALTAAAIAFGLAAVGAGIAISNVGAAAIGAIGEKPELFGRTLIFVSLAEGLLIIGFAFGILLIFL